MVKPRSFSFGERQHFLKKDGTAYFSVFEGANGQSEGPTKSGYQLAKKTQDYVDDIANVFGKNNVKRYGKTIIAIKK